MTRRLSFVLLFVALGLLPPNLLALDQKTINDRIKQMEMMSKVDRDRLDRNIQAFKELGNDQKTQFRILHDELATDRAQAGGLSALLQTYATWVQTLSPAERDELQHATDSAQKLAIIRRLKEEHEHPKASHEHEPHHEESLPHPHPKFPPKGALDSKDLAAVMKVIVDNLPADKAKKEFDPPQLSNYLQIISASTQSVPNYRDWPDETLVQRMTNVIRNKDVATGLLKSNSKRETFVKLILLGIMKQVTDSVRFPSEEERIQTYEALTPAERQAIMAHPRDEVERLLSRKFFDSKGDESYKRIPIYARQVNDMFERLEVQAPARLRARQRPQPAKG